MGDSTHADRWHAIVDKALPMRELKVDRVSLINSIVEEITSWTEAAPKIEPHTHRLRQIGSIATNFDTAIEKANAALLELGLEREYDKAIAERVAIGINRENMGFGSASPAIDLHLILWRAADSLQTWRRLYGRRGGRPLEFAASLTKNLQYLL